jgi:hypothetical protein
LMRNQKITQLEEELERANGAAGGEENDGKTTVYDVEGSMDGMEEIGSDNDWYEEQNQAESEQIQPIAQPRRSRSPSFEDETEPKWSNDFEEADPEDILKEFMDRGGTRIIFCRRSSGSIYERPYGRFFAMAPGPAAANRQLC